MIAFGEEKLMAFQRTTEDVQIYARSRREIAKVVNSEEVCRNEIVNHIISTAKSQADAVIQRANVQIAELTSQISHARDRYSTDLHVYKEFLKAIDARFRDPTFKISKAEVLYELHWWFYHVDLLYREHFPEYHKRVNRFERRVHMNPSKIPAASAKFFGETLVDKGYDFLRTFVNMIFHQVFVLDFVESPETGELIFCSKAYDEDGRLVIKSNDMLKPMAIECLKSSKREFITKALPELHKVLLELWRTHGSFYKEVGTPLIKIKDNILESMKDLSGLDILKQVLQGEDSSFLTLYSGKFATKKDLQLFLRKAKNPDDIAVGRYYGEIGHAFDVIKFLYEKSLDFAESKLREELVANFEKANENAPIDRQH